jgi:predicted metalloenzyme YecM
MRKEDTPMFLSDFLTVRTAALLDAFRNWARAHSYLESEFAPRADHLSYKCREFREYDELKSRFQEHADDGWRGSRFLHETVISGRLVSVFGLIDPIPTPFGDLRVLELSQPRTMRAEQQGFDHVEIYPTRGTIDELAEALNTVRNRSVATSFMRSYFKKKERPHHATWDGTIVSMKYGADFTLRLTDGPLVEKIGQEMRERP